MVQHFQFKCQLPEACPISWRCFLALWVLAPAVVMDLQAAPVKDLHVTSELPSQAERIGGQWDISRDVITQSKISNQPSFLVFGETDWNDYSVQAKVKFADSTSGSEAGLVFQLRSGSSYLVFSLIQRKGGPFALLRYENGGPEQGPVKRLVGDQARHEGLDLKRWHELRADVHGTQVTCFLDGEPAVNFWFSGSPPRYNAHGKIWKQDPDHGKVGLITINGAVQFSDLRVKPLKDFSHIVTPLSGRRDSAGKLLPRQSYDETMRGINQWLVNSAEVVDRGQLPGPVQELEPYIAGHFVTTDDVFWAAEDFAFNSATNIISSVQYYHYSGDRRALEMAQKVGDWHLANCSPADWAFPSMSPGWLKWESDGSYAASRWELDKTAYIGLGFLKLYAASGQEKYLRGAKNIAAMLRPRQKEDGSFPFRVDAKTGEILEDYACSQLWHVWFFEHLAHVTGNQEDLKRSEKTLQWMLDGPVKNNEWTGLYGDYGNRGSYDQWVALETAMYLLERRDEFAGAVQIAEDLLAYVNRTLTVDYGFHPGAPGVLEQSRYRVVLTHHSLRLAEMYALLYQVTGNISYKEQAVEIANSVTWCVMSDGKMRQGFWWHYGYCPVISLFHSQFCRLMACIPETAPIGENHLVANRSFLAPITYEPDRITYASVGPGEETLIVRSEPKTVLVGSKALAKLRHWGYGQDGWQYDKETGLLRVKHRVPDVEIRF